MSLERVKNTVVDAAKAKAEAIVADARKQAESLVSDSKAAADRKSAEVIRDAKLRLERETNRELERIQYENRLEMLSAKNKAVDEVFKRVGAALEKMTDDEYVGMVGKWLAELPDSVGGTLRVNPRDEAKFSSRLGELNKGRNGTGKFEKVEGDAKIASGAVVNGPDYDIDCTFGRRILELRESVVGDLAKILFG